MQCGCVTERNMGLKGGGGRRERTEEKDVDVMQTLK